jgi:hypothetical protein
MSTAPAPIKAPPAPAAIPESFWKRVTGFFQAAGHLVSEAFVKLFGQEAATQFASASLALLKTTVGQIALGAVTEASKAASGAEAQKTAFTNIVAQVTKLGLTAKDSEVNMLIEVALQAVKGSFGAAAV